MGHYFHAVQIGRMVELVLNWSCCAFSATEFRRMGLCLDRRHGAISTCLIRATMYPACFFHALPIVSFVRAPAE